MFLMSQMLHISFFKRIFYVCEQDLWSECTFCSEVGHYCFAVCVCVCVCVDVDVSCSYSVRVTGHGCVLSVRRSTASGECSVASMGADERHRQCQLRGVAVWQRCGWAMVGRAVTQLSACLENWEMAGIWQLSGETSRKCQTIWKCQFLLLLRVFTCLKNPGMYDSLIADPKSEKC